MFKLVKYGIMIASNNKYRKARDNYGKKKEEETDNSIYCMFIRNRNISYY